MALDLQEWVGRTEHVQDLITPSLLKRYNAVIGEVPRGPAVPYGLHWCSCLPSASMDELGLDGHPKTGEFLPPSPLPRRMWAASNVSFLSPMVAGASIDRHSKILSVTEKSGRSGDLLFVDVEHITQANGVDCIRETQTIVYRGAPAQKGVLPEPKAVDLSEWAVSELLTPSTALLFRFSALTFNTHRIHYDFEYATEVEGYPGLVVHGPLMASLLLRFVTGLAKGKVLKEFSFRGKSPAFCGQDIYLVANPSDEGFDLAVIGVNGHTVMSARATL